MTSLLVRRLDRAREDLLRRLEAAKGQVAVKEAGADAAAEAADRTAEATAAAARKAQAAARRFRDAQRKERQLRRLLRYIERRNASLFAREMAALEEEERLEREAAAREGREPQDVPAGSDEETGLSRLPAGSPGGGCALGSSGVPEESLDRYRVALTPPPGFASWEDALGLGGQGFVGGIPG